MLTPIAPPNHWPTRTTSSTSVTLGAGDAVLLCSNSSDATVALPSAATVPGQIFAVKKIGNNAHTVTLDPNGSETIDGATSYVLYVVGDYVVIQSDGTNWRVVGGYLTPHSCTLVRANVQEDIANATQTKILLDSTASDVGGLADIANSRATIRRAGDYRADGRWAAITTGRIYAQVRINGAVRIRGLWEGTGAGVSYDAIAFGKLTLSAGDHVELYVVQFSGGDLDTLTDEQTRPALTIEEVR